MNIAIILSGGIGTRMSSNIPKQYIEVNNKPIISYCIEKFEKRHDIDAIVIGAAREWRDYLQEHLKNSSKPIFYSDPGETRQFTIYNALKLIRKEGFNKHDIVIIHDAARPMVSDKIIYECINGLKEGYEGVLPVIHVKDTIYQSKDGINISSLLNRNELFAGQAPESFRLGKYLAVHENMSNNEIKLINGSTEIAYKAGLKIKLIQGSELNFKITTPEDLINFKQIMNI